MTREEAIHFAECLKNNWTIDFNDMEDFCDMAIEALSAKTDAHDLVHRNAVKPKLVDCSCFLLWLLDEVMNEDNWELNAVAKGETICRKLKKLGLLEVKDGYYVRVLSAEAEPTVIRSKTLMPTKDFKEWAKRIKEENSNVIVIPYDAEVPSAEAVHGEWVDIDNYYGLATCSHCHKVTMFEKWGEYTIPYDFCPNCGLPMKIGGDNE